MAETKSPSWQDLRREYLRSWRKKNPDKVRQYNREYWIRKASQIANSNSTDEGETNAANNTI